MTVFIYEPQPPRPADRLTKDEFNTDWFQITASCLFCGERFERGQRVWHWSVAGGASDLRAHAECAGRNARGIIKDMAECTR